MSCYRCPNCSQTPTCGCYETLLKKNSILLAALGLVDEVWERANQHPEVNHLGDDEHEAWTKVKQAIAEATEGKVKQLIRGIWNGFVLSTVKLIVHWFFIE